MPQKPAAPVDTWRLIGRGRLRFPTLPRQLFDLMSPCCMQKKTHHYVRSWRSVVGLLVAINEEGREPP